MDRPSSATLDAARAARTAAVWARRPEIRTLELTGPDRARYLNGQVTQDVLALRPGQGAMAVKTSAKGRCEALLRVRVREGAVLVDLREIVAEPTRAALERYIIMDDCEVRDVSGTRAVLTVIGPQRRAALAAAGLSVPEELAPHAFVEVDGITVIADRTLGLDALELHGPPARIEAIARGLTVPEAPAEALEILRVEEGVPVDGQDLDVETIPLEAHLEHAISMTKGCYTGQEVIARATNLGGVNWSLVGLVVEGDRPLAVDAALRAEASAEGDDAAKVQGQVTSVVWSPRVEAWIALGFVRKAYQDAGARLWSGDRAVTVAALPFRR